MAVLLEEHPTKHFRLISEPFWPQRRPRREIEEERARVAQDPAIRESDSGYFSHGIYLKEAGIARLASILPYIHPPEGQASVSKDHLDLVDVARIEVAEERQHFTCKVIGGAKRWLRLR